MANKKLYKKERFSGCIVGAAAGDALGSPVKTLTRSQIKDLYGKKGILKLSPEKRQKTARISDETQMMLFTAHGILWADAAGLRTGEANCADYVFLALQQWLYSQTGGTSSIDLQWILDDNETGFPCDLPVGNKTGHGCDQSAKTSQIGADDEGLCLCREPGQQQGGGNITGDLRSKDRHQHFPTGQKLLQPAGKGRNAPQIANEDEKSHKGQKQGIVHCP